jgi:hypothetical protein
MLLGIFIFIEYHRNDQIFKFEDTKAIVRSHKLKNRQYNSKKRKRQTMVSKTLHRKLKIEQHEPLLKLVVYSGVLDM